MPPPIVQLAREMLHDPVTINVERKAAPAIGITQAVYPVPAGAEVRAARRACSSAATCQSVIVFTRTKHRANRLADYLARTASPCERIHGNRSQAQRTQALDGFKDGKFRVLVATDIAARGIDVEALGHVDQLRRARTCPRTTSTASAARRAPRRPATPSRSSRPTRRATSRSIERAIGKRAAARHRCRVRLQPRGRSRELEVPIAERIAEIRARKAEERERAKEKAERRAQVGAQPPGPASPAGLAATAPRPGPPPAPGLAGPTSPARRDTGRNGSLPLLAETRTPRKRTWG